MKKKRNWQLLGLLVVVVLITAGCVAYDSAGNPTGWVYEYFGRPAAALLDFIAQIFFGSYGMAIIVVTVITRIFMLPSSLKMTKDTMLSQARMKIAQPEIDAIKEELNQETDPAKKAALNQEIMAVYKKYDINMLGGMSGCLPLLIQMPIISAVYAAIRTSPSIQASSFLGIPLGSRSLLMTVLVVVTSFVQSWLMQRQMPTTDNSDAASGAAAQTSKMMMWMNPILFGWISMSADAGLGLYFLTGSVFLLFQQLYTNRVVRPRIQEIIDQEQANVKVTPRRPRRDVTVQKHADTNKKRLVPTKSAVQSVGRRNEGKQQRRK